MEERVDVPGFFRSRDPNRDKFLARLFGLFSESIVRDWCDDPRAPYEDLGRPTLWASGDERGSTLDFTLRDRRTQKTYVAEMKVELEFEGYRYMTLERLDQLAHHRLPAFLRFLELARDPYAYEVHVRAKPISVDGAILIWGAVTEKGRNTVTTETGLHDVVSIDAVLQDLRKWRPASYAQRIGALRRAANDLFDWMT